MRRPDCGALARLASAVAARDRPRPVHPVYTPPYQTRRVPHSIRLAVWITRDDHVELGMTEKTETIKNYRDSRGEVRRRSFIFKMHFL